MQLKIGLAAAVFAAVGTFAVAEGAGEGGCGIGDCRVGTVLNFSPKDLRNSLIPYAGHIEFTAKEESSVSVFQSGLRDGYQTSNDFTGVYIGFNELWPEGVEPFMNTGNCSGEAGESGTNGCNPSD